MYIQYERVYVTRIKVDCTCVVQPKFIIALIVITSILALRLKLEKQYYEWQTRLFVSIFFFIYI